VDLVLERMADNVRSAQNACARIQLAMFYPGPFPGRYHCPVLVNRRPLSGPMSCRVVIQVFFCTRAMTKQLPWFDPRIDPPTGAITENWGSWLRCVVVVGGSGFCSVSKQI